MDRATELIERYLDDVATPAERAELAALVAGDPAVADALARATRIDARLRQLAGSDRQPQALDRAAARPALPLLRSWKVWAAAAGALILLGGLAGAWLLFSGHRVEPALETRTSPADRPPDVVGLVEGVSTVQQQQVINGVAQRFAETRLALVVHGGAAATPGSRRTVRLTGSTQPAVLPAPGDVVQVWLAAGTEDVVDTVEIGAPH